MSLNASARIEVVNRDVNQAFTNSTNADMIIYTETSNQSIHLGCGGGVGCNVASTLLVTRSNVQVLGDITLTGNMYKDGQIFKTGGGNVAGLSNTSTSVYVMSGSNFGVGLANPESLLHVAGNARIDGDIALLNKTLTFSGISLKQTTIPTNGLITSTVTAIPGIDSSTVGEIAISSGCNLAIKGGQILCLSNDTVSAPSYSWNNDTDTGIYHQSNDVIGFAANGVRVMSLSNGGVDIFGSVNFTGNLTKGGQAFQSGTQGLGNVGNEVRVLTGSNLVMQGGQILGWSNDTVTTPAYTWSNNSNTGMYHQENNVIGFTANGVHVMGLSNGGLNLVGDINFSGALRRQGVDFQSGTQGLCNVGIEVRVITGSNLVMQGGQILGWSNDTVTTPAYTWSNNSNTGMYHQSNNVIGFTANGTHVASISSSGINTATTISTTGGRVGVGTSNPSFPIHVKDVNAIDAGADILLEKHGNSALSSYVVHHKSRGTATAPTAVLQNDIIGASFCRAYDGTTYQDVSEISSRAETNATTNNVSSMLTFSTRNAGVNAPLTQKMCIKGDGKVGINTSTPTQILDVNGNINASGNINFSGSLTMNGQPFQSALTVDMSDVENIDLTKSWSVLGTVGPVWGAAIDGANNDTAVSVSINAADNIMVAGNYSNNTAVFPANSTTPSSFTLPTSSSGVFVVRYNTAGTPQWSAAIGGATASNVVNQMTTDTTNNTYVVGNYSNAAPTVFNASGTTTTASTIAISAPPNNNQSAFVVKYNDAGVALWSAHNINSAGPVSADAVSVSQSSSANVYVAGKYQSAAPALYNGINGSISTSTIAGSRNIGFQNSTLPSFYSPFGCCLDSSGTTMYVSDLNSNRIRKVVLSTGAVSTVAGAGNQGSVDSANATSASFNNPFGICIDSTDSTLYVAEFTGNRIRRIVLSTGTVTTVAGSATGTFADGTSALAGFNNPSGICIDASSILYVADWGNHRIRRIVASTGEVTTVVGSGNATFADGTGTSAGFNNPSGICIHTNSTLYVADHGNNRIRRIVISTGAVTTIAGSSFPSATNGTGTLAGFWGPRGICIDSTNSILYVADQLNNRIRSCVISTGAVTTIAGSGSASYLDATGTWANFNGPAALCIDPLNPTTLYVADTTNHRIRRIVLSTGVVTLLAGSGSAAFADTYYGLQVGFNLPFSSCLDPSGTILYVADRSNNRIRKVVLATGVVSTIAGSGTPSFADGTGINAMFSAPCGICMDPTGTSLYIADVSNNRIRRITSLAGPNTGQVTTVAGSGTATFADGTGTSASFNGPFGICTDSTNSTLYVADNGNNRIRRIVLATGVVTTIAGSGTGTFANGTGTSASFNNPGGVCIDSTNSTLYVADTSNHRVRQIVVSTGQVTTVAGSGTGTFTDGTGVSASFNGLIGVCIDSTNSTLYIGDGNNNRIRRIVLSTGVVTTVAGSGTQTFVNSTGTLAGFNTPSGVCIDSTNTTLYVADQNNHRIRMITSLASPDTGVVTTVAGSGTATFTDTISLDAQFNSITGVAVNPAEPNTLYVADQNNCAIRSISTTTRTTTTWSGSAFTPLLASASRFSYPQFNCLDSSGAIMYVADYGSHLIRRIILSTGVVTTIAGSGTGTFADSTGTLASFNNPTGICIDSTNSILYIADYNNNRIRKITSLGPNTGVVTTIAGSGTGTFADGTGTLASFRNPAGVCIDSTNSTLYVADYANQRIRRITSLAGPNTGVVTTVAGDGTATFADGTGTSASFYRPMGICIDSTNSILYIADYNNNRIRKITSLGPNTGVVTTIAGSGTGTFADGTGTSASFRNPAGVFIDSTNSTLYIADVTNHRIRRITSLAGPNTGVVTTVAGSGTATFADGTGTSASFNAPYGVCIDTTNSTLYVTDQFNNRIRKITSLAGPNTGVVTTIAGDGIAGVVDTQSLQLSRLNSPYGCCINSSGTVMYFSDSGNNRIRMVVLSTGVVTTLAGSGDAGFLDATGVFARFNNPRGICLDSTNSNLYVTDYSNHRIRLVVLSTGEVTTFAGSGTAGSLDGIGTNSQLNGPLAICIDTRNPSILYSVDQYGNRVRKIVISTREVTTFATDFFNPTGICIDPAFENLYVSDASNNRICKVVIATQAVTRLAGSATRAQGATDGTGIGATFKTPYGLWYDTTSSSPALYVADHENNRIRKITSLAGPDTGVVTTITESTGTTAAFFYPIGLCLDPSNQVLYVTEFTGHRIRKVVLSPRDVTTLAGDNTQGYLDTKYNPSSICFDSSSNAYITDYNYHVIRKISTVGRSETIFAGGVIGSVDGNGVAASFRNPVSICIDSSTNFFVADQGNHTIRRITSAGVVTTFAGTAGTTGFTNGTGTTAIFNLPSGVCVDTSGNIYVADTLNHSIRKITPVGVVTTLAGTNTLGYLDATGTNARFFNPVRVACDNTGNVYVCDQGNRRIRMVTQGGVVSTIVGRGQDGNIDGNGTLAAFSRPTDIYVNPLGTIVYVTDSTENTIRQVSTLTLPPLSSVTLPAPIASSQPAYIVKYNSDGIAQFSININGPGCICEINSLEIAPLSENIYITGTYTGTPTLSGTTSTVTLRASTSRASFVARFSSAGVLTWASVIDGISNDTVTSIAVDTIGSIFVSGFYSNSSQPPVLYTSINTPAASVPVPSLPSGTQAAFIVRYPANTGNPAWVARIDGVGVERVNRIRVDANNNVYVVGQYSDATSSPILYNADGSASSSILPVPANNQTKGFVAMYNQAGVAVDAMQVDGSGAQALNDIGIDSIGNIFVVGSYTTAAPVVYTDNAVNTNAVTLPTPQNTAAYLVRYTKTNRASYNLASTLTSSNNGFTKYITNNGPTTTTINVKVASVTSTNQFTFQLDPNSTSSLGWANRWFKFN